MRSKPQEKSQDSMSELRRLYAELRHHKRFEDVAALFDPEDLEYLLRDSNRVKLTYIYDAGNVPNGEDLREWVDAGVIAHLARGAITAGYSWKSLQEAVNLAMTLDGVAHSRQGWLELLISYPASAEYLRSFAEAAVDGTWLEAGLKARVSVDDLKTLIALGVPPRYVTEKILTGVADCHGIQDWFLAGISPRAAEQFIEVGFNPETSLNWLQAGFTPSEAIKLSRKKLSPSSARTSCPEPSFSQAFRKTAHGIYSMKAGIADRVREAVAALDVPAIYNSMMFSSSSTQTAFLDGGHIDVGGYGFGSHSYSVIVGEDAVRFVCHRIGVRPPREKSKVASSAAGQLLEQMLVDQRRDQMDELLSRAQKPHFK